MNFVQAMELAASKTNVRHFINMRNTLESLMLKRYGGEFALSRLTKYRNSQEIVRKTFLTGIPPNSLCVFLFARYFTTYHILTSRRHYEEITKFKPPSLDLETALYKQCIETLKQDYKTVVESDTYRNGVMTFLPQDQAGKFLEAEQNIFSDLQTNPRLMDSFNAYNRDTSQRCNRVFKTDIDILDKAIRCRAYRGW